MRRLLAGSSFGLLAALLVAAGAGCGPNKVPARIKYLEQEHRTLDYRRTQVMASEEQETRYTELRRVALQRAREADKEALGGDGDFIALHRDLFDNAIKLLLPSTWEREGYTFRFPEHRLELRPDGIELKLRYVVSSAELTKSGIGSPEGWLRTRLVLGRGEGGRLNVTVEPELLDVDDRYYRAARDLQSRFRPAAFTGVLPVIPLPLAIPDEVAWNGRVKKVEVSLHASHALVLPERVLIPFSLKVGDAPPRTVEAPAPVPSTPSEAAIPVGQTPEGVNGGSFQQ